MGVALVGAWVYVLRCSMGGCLVARVCLGGGVGVGVDAPVAAKISASCRMASMVWASNGEKGVVGAGFARASARRLDTSMVVSEEDMDGMAPLCGEK